MAVGVKSAVGFTVLMPLLVLGPVEMYKYGAALLLRYATPRFCTVGSFHYLLHTF